MQHISMLHALGLAALQAKVQDEHTVSCLVAEAHSVAQMTASAQSHADEQMQVVKLHAPGLAPLQAALQAPLQDVQHTYWVPAEFARAMRPAVRVR